MVFQVSSADTSEPTVGVTGIKNNKRRIISTVQGCFVHRGVGFICQTNFNNLPHLSLPPPNLNISLSSVSTYSTSDSLRLISYTLCLLLFFSAIIFIW